MAQEFKIQIVSLPELKRIVASDPRYATAHKDPESIWGFADKAKGRIVVRDTKRFDLNQYLLNHEIGHLLEEEGTDEDEHGIRYKKVFKEIIAPTLPFLAAIINPFAGVAGAGAFGTVAAGAANAALVGGAQAISSKAQGGSATQGFKQGVVGGLVQQGIQGLTKFFGGGQATSPQAGRLNAPGSAASTASGLATGSAAGGGTGSPLSGGIQNFGLNIPSQNAAAAGLQPGPLQPGGGGGITSSLQAPSLTTNPATGASSGLGRFGQAAGTLLLGQGLGTLAGQGKGPLAGPTVPSLITPRVSALEELAKQGTVTPLGGEAASALQQIVNQQFPQELTDFQNTQNTQELQFFESQFKQFRPNADVATDTAFLRGRQQILDAQAARFSNAVLNFQGQQINAAQQLLGVDRASLETLASIAQLEVDQIIAQFNVDFATAQAIKEQFGGLAALFAPGFGGGGININIGGGTP